MNRKPKIAFSIRALLLFTAFVAVGVFFFHRDPRPYKELDWFTNSYDLRGWSIEIEPDLPGPYRAAGDDWSGALPFQFNPGKPAKGWVESGGAKRTYNHPGRAGVSYIVVALETTDDAPTYLILSKPDDNSASSGG